MVRISPCMHCPTTSHGRVTSTPGVSAVRDCGLHHVSERDRHHGHAAARLGSMPALRGPLTTATFLAGLLQATRARLPVELQTLEARQQGSLIKFFADEPLVHFELWVHHGRGRVEM